MPQIFDSVPLRARALADLLAVYSHFGRRKQLKENLPVPLVKDCHGQARDWIKQKDSLSLQVTDPHLLIAEVKFRNPCAT